MKVFFVDAFTNEPFRGNPAGVCLVDGEIDAVKMQLIAKEIGFSETAFLKKMNGENRYNIRYFSPKQEIPLCGHATLASAKVLFESSDGRDILFLTGNRVEISAWKDREQITMGFPVYDTTAITVPDSLKDALGLKEFKQASYSAVNKIVLLEIEDAGILKALKPDFGALVKSYQGINGVLVTAPSNVPGYDFHYRYFWPWAGTNEDPVTGGVQTFLTKYWSQRLNKLKLRAFQSSERTGHMTTEWRGNQVLVSGSAVIILAGELKI